MSDGACDAVAVLDEHSAVLGLVTAADLVRLLGCDDTPDGDAQ